MRDYGRGIPLGKLVDCVSIINTGAKYDSETFQKAVGLNGVGQKAVNALSLDYRAQAIREGETKVVEFAQGKLKKESRVTKTDERNGTLIEFTPDEALFGKDFKFRTEFIEDMLWNYAFLNRGLTLTLNGKPLQVRERPEGSAHQGTQRRAALSRSSTSRARTSRSPSPTATTTARNTGRSSTASTPRWAARTSPRSARRSSRPCAITSRRTTTPPTSASRSTPPSSCACRSRSSSRRPRPSSARPTSGPKGPSIKEFVGKFLQQALDTYLHKNRETAEIIKKKIEENEHERKELAGIRNIARERAKKASLHNHKLRDCRLHLGDRNERAEESTLFIVEGDSAAGSLTTRRDVQTQAVFALKGKPLNTYGLTKKVIYENEEFHLLQSALNIEDGLDGLRYNKIVIATDADVDGMHIRLLLISFFLQFFPDLIRNGHLFILQTPLFRVRNKKETIYCYTEAGETGRHRRARREPRDHALQGPRRNLRRRVQGLHRREHPPRAGQPAPPLQQRRTALLLHGQEHARAAGLHHRQPPGREGPDRGLSDARPFHPADSPAGRWRCSRRGCAEPPVSVAHTGRDVGGSAGGAQSAEFRSRVAARERQVFRRQISRRRLGGDEDALSSRRRKGGR